MKLLGIKRSTNPDYFKKQDEIKKGRVVTTAELKRLANGEVEYDRKYKLAGYKNFHGLKLAIENQKGTYRRGTSPTGEKWETLMDYDYGRIVGTKAVDNEGVDFFLGPDDTSEMVYVVHQVDPHKGHRYDEDKCLLQFPSREAAIEGYLSQYDRPDYLGPVSEFTVPEFKEALENNKGNLLYKSPIEYETPEIRKRYVIKVKK